MKLLVSLLYLADSEMGTNHVFAWILISQKHDSIPASEPLCDIVTTVEGGARSQHFCQHNDKELNVPLINTNKTHKQVYFPSLKA